MQKTASGGTNGFDVRQTHGILWRPEHSIQESSDRLGWDSLYVSQQHEMPYESAFHGVRDHLVILHLNGPVEVERRVGQSPLRSYVAPGGLFSMPGGVDFWVRLRQPLDTVHLYVRDHILREVAEDLYHGDPDRLELQPMLGDIDPVIASIAKAASAAVTAQDGGAGLLADYLARALGARLLASASGRTAHAAPHSRALGRKQHDKIRDFVETHLAHPIGLADLAGIAGMSATRLARSFKLDFGTTPYHYVLTTRLQHARKLLEETNLPIVEIALRCGFSHQEHLTRLFRREIGTTPAAFRRLDRR